MEINRICANCGKELKDIFHNYCSVKCANSSNVVKEKRKQTCILKYGVENPFQNENCKSKIKETMIKKYGVENPNQFEMIKKKSRETNLKRYGTEHPMQSEEIQSKVRKTNLDNYGTVYTFQSEKIKDKCRQSLIENFGVDNALKSEEIKKKIRKTCVDKYGVDWASKVEEIKKRAGKTYSTNHRKKMYQEFIQMLEKQDIEMLSTYEDYVNNEILKFKCLVCDKEFHSPYSISSAVVFCESCCKNKYNRSENEVFKFISELIPDNIILRNKREVISPLELDLYIPDKNLAIEYNGNYWHSSNICRTSQNYHLTKTNLCKEKGILLLHIFEHEWLYKKEIVKSIIRSKLSIFDRMIYARKCEIKALSNEEYKRFLEENHLQGYTPSKIKLGLFYKDELIACIGIGKSRFKKNEIELIRFCTKLNTKVTGGLSKLIKHSGVTNLISYVDLRYFNGSGYTKAGFELIGQSKPGYIYVKNTQVLTRYQCQKHKLPKLLGSIFNPDLTEVENMTLAGYYQLYDCGMLKFRYKNK